MVQIFQKWSQEPKGIKLIEIELLPLKNNSEWHQKHGGSHLSVEDEDI